MPIAIALRGFIGEQPRILPRLMPENAAQSAVNCRLDDGGLTPFRRSAVIEAVASAAYQTIYRHGATWLGWSGVVNAAPGPVAQDRLYYTGDGAPKMRVGTDVYDLAIDLPSPALTATLSGSGSGDVATRLYVYTWVTSFGEESEPSPVSNSVDWQPGYDVVLSGFAATPTGRAITHQRIYRSQTGQSGTYFYLIAERAAATTDFTDDIAVDAFQEPLPSANWNAPPDDLEGLIALPNGMMAAFAGRKLYFCEPFRPHAWPEKYVLTTDANIVALGGIGTSIVVLTVAQPYMVNGSAPETMVMEKIEHNLPCINGRGVVDLGYAIAYPSNDGLVVIRGDGSFSVATANIFNPTDWQALSPADMIGSQINGRYVAFYESEISGQGHVGGALLIDLTGSSFLIRADSRASATFYSVEEGGLYYLKKDTTSIERFDAPNAIRRKMYWRSKEFVLPTPMNFGAILIDAPSRLTAQEQVDIDAESAAVLAANEALIAAGPIGGEVDGAAIDDLAVDGDTLEPLPTGAGLVMVVNVYADGALVRSITRANRPQRLPDGFLARTWEIDVYGDVQVESIVMGKTIDDVKATL